MIEFTIKTLDSNNHHFSVDDEITVQQLKEKVRDTMGIDIHLQRLIFCGRVLQDDKKLAEYDVHGKVLHLVQRAPPSPESRQPSSSTNSANPDQNGGAQQQLRRLMAMATPAGFLIEDRQALTLRPALTPTTGRLEFIQRMLGEVRSSLAALRLHVNQERSGEPAGSDTEVDMDNEPSSSVPPDEQPVDLDDTSEDAPDAAARALNARRRSYRPIRALRARHARPRDLAQLLEELGGLQECFAPYRTRYIRMLQNANNPAVLSRSTDEERERDQRTVDMVNDIMHSLAHAYHALSDINFTVNQRNPRLTSEPSVVRHPIPMQAHINVVQSNRRPQQQTNNGASAPATQTSANTVPPPEAPNNQNNQPAPDNAQAGRNPTQASVNINVQPDPVTYQVEIETRLPIAFALDNAMIHGLNPSATVNQPPQPQQPEPNQQQPNRNGQPNQAAPNAAAGQPGQANRRQVLFDFENLFRGLGQGASLGGVEVVMSMEEIPQAGNVTGGGVGVGPTAGTGANPAPAAAAPAGMPQVDGGNAPQPLFGADIYLGAMPWGGAPSADLLQNIVSSVIRQGLVPGVEGIAVHAMPPQAAPQAQPQAQTQGQGETPSPEQLQNGTQGNQEQANQNGQPRQPNLHLRRATTTTRAQAVSLNNLFYDRYLSCDSNYARRRREQYQARQAAQERQRAERVAAQNIEALTYHNEHITEVHMQTLLQLLNGAPSREAWFNALMVAIARQLFMPDIMQVRPGETALIPSEFPQLRQMLRSSIEDLIERSGEHEGETSYQTVADFLVHQHLYFLNRMDSMSPQRRDIDVYNSILSLIRCRLPAVISAVMLDSSADTQVARFYRVFSRLFTDLCALVAYCCEDGSEGLRDIAAYYLEEFVQSLPQSTSRLLVTLGMENMNALMVNMPIHIEAIMTYVRRRENYHPLIQTQQSPDQSPMELSPETNETEELMQTSPPSTPSLTQDTETSTSSDETTEGSTTCPVHAPISNRTQTVTSGSLAAADVPTTPAPTIQTQRTPKPEKSESPENREDTDSNVRFVPPVLLVQHWGEEWVPVFTRDQQVQSPEPQEPYSDAYLSGMPSRKRRCLRQARPSASLDGFMNESVREAAERTPTTDNSSIRSAFREHMRNMARSRASNSEEYDPQRYASAERFLNPTKSDKPDPESSSD